MGEYWRPETVEEAVERLASGPTTVIAGGTDVFPVQKTARLSGNVLDLSRIENLREISKNDRGWRIGATATWADVVEEDLPPCFDALKAAAREVGGPQIQNAGTVGGNICNASPAADGVPPLLALNAVVQLQDREGRREVPLEEFILGNRRTLMRAGEILTGIVVPAPPRGARSAFVKLGARRYQVISIVSVAGVMAADDEGRITDVCLAIGSCAEKAVRLKTLERRLKGSPIANAGRVEAADLSPLAPIDDCRGSAAYRLDAAGVLVGRLLDDLGGQLESAA
jgi:CO/xanthine dehydrogenase FAD-binding subunit